MKIRITALLLTVVTLLILLPGCGKAEAELEITSTKATEEPEMMVPKNANLYFPRPNGDIELQVALNFCWDENGYLARIEADRISEGKTIRLTQYFKQKTDGWYSTIDFLRYAPDWDDLSTLNGPFELEPGQCELGDWWYQEDPYCVGMIHAICTKITAGSRNYQNPARTLNEFSRDNLGNLTEDSIKQLQKETWADLSYWYDAEGKIRISDDVYNWKHVDLQYDAYGNAIRIDTYSMDDNLVGYIEIEWDVLDSVSAIYDEPTIPTSIVVPEVAYSYYLEEDDTKPWGMRWDYTWDNRGYLTKFTASPKYPGDKNYDPYFAYYYAEYKGEWYSSRMNSKYKHEEIPASEWHPCHNNHERGSAINSHGGYSEGHSKIGFGHTMVSLQITEDQRNYSFATRIYNIPYKDHVHDEDCGCWLYADYTYDDYGNPIRIDTYNLKEELCGYTEIEWMEIEIQP